MSAKVVTVVFGIGETEPFVTIDGLPIDGDIRLETSVEAIEDVDAEKANGYTWKCYKPGTTTWTLRNGDEVVFTTTDRPLRTETDKYINYIWVIDQIEVTSNGDTEPKYIDAPVVPMSKRYSVPRWGDA